MAHTTRYILYTTGRTDPTFNNIWGFSTSDERETWLETKQRLVLPNNKYWRVGVPIKIPVNYEDSFKYDYVKIINREGTQQEQTYFAFIIGRAYLSANSTTLELAVDYIQSFYFTGGVPFWRVSGLVNRATMPNAYRPARGLSSDYPVPEVACSSIYEPTSTYYYLVYSTIDLVSFMMSPTANPTYRSVAVDDVVMAAAPYLFTSAANLYTLITLINGQGYTATISGIYCVPSEFLSSVPSSAMCYHAEDYVTVTKTITVEQPTTCGGYTPRNKGALLSHDYTYIVISNNQGETQQYKFEDFAGTPTFTIRCSLTAGYPVLLLYPQNYIFGAGNDSALKAQKCNSPIQCTYLNDSYKIWLAQTQNSRAAAIDGANLAISQAKEARANSLAYQIYKQGNGVIKSASQTIGNAVGSVVTALGGGA